MKNGILCAQAAVVEQPDDQASQLALCYDAAADTEADAAAVAAAVSAEEPHLLTTVALFAAFTLLSCTGIYPWVMLQTASSSAVHAIALMPQVIFTMHAATVQCDML